MNQQLTNFLNFFAFLKVIKGLQRQLFVDFCLGIVHNMHVTLEKREEITHYGLHESRTQKATRPRHQVCSE